MLWVIEVYDEDGKFYIILAVLFSLVLITAYALREFGKIQAENNLLNEPDFNIYEIELTPVRIGHIMILEIAFISAVIFYYFVVNNDFDLGNALIFIPVLGVITAYLKAVTMYYENARLVEVKKRQYINAQNNVNL